MEAIDVNNISKSFNGKEIIKDISFRVHQGEVFGLLGPNGAGKTTTIRMLLEIISPDSGTISIMGKNASRLKDRIGYLPEERGLYKKRKVLEVLEYFGMLKGLERKEAKSRATHLLKNLGLEMNMHMKVQELSKGMQQKVQLIATLIHNPHILILDEPFSGLDPVNSRLIKDIIIQEKQKGKSIILSTHMMYEVERMCDRILMINQGGLVLYGNLSEIKKKFGKNALQVEYSGELGELSGVLKIEDYGKYAEILPEENTSPGDILRQLIDKDLEIKRFETAQPSLDEIFVSVVEGRK